MRYHSAARHLTERDVAELQDAVLKDFVNQPGISRILQDTGVVNTQVLYNLLQDNMEELVMFGGYPSLNRLSETDQQRVKDGVLNRTLIVIRTAMINAVRDLGKRR